MDHRSAPHRSWKCTTILNRSARMLQKGDPEEIRAELETSLRAVGMNGPVQLVDSDGLRPALHAAVAAKPDLILVGGGDGTLSTAVSILCGSEIALGPLPLGTLNHFARDLGIATDYRQAIAQLAAGELRRVDVGEVNGLAFVNNSVLGIYPEIVRVRERLQSSWGLAKWPAMALAALRAMAHFRRLSVRLSVGGATHRTHVPMLGISNNLYDKVARLTLHRSRLDGGTLGIYLARARSPIRLARAVVAAFQRKGGLAASAAVLEASECVVTGRQRHLLVALDGEVIRMRLPLHYRLRPQAVLVLAPPGERPHEG